MPRARDTEEGGEQQKILIKTHNTNGYKAMGLDSKLKNAGLCGCGGGLKNRNNEKPSESVASQTKTLMQSTLWCISQTNLCMRQQQKPSTGRRGQGHFPPTCAECPHCRSTLLDEPHLKNQTTPPPAHPCHHYC